MKKAFEFTFMTRLFVLAAVYVIGGYVGEKTGYSVGAERPVPLFLPPAGIGLAAILLFGYRFWPGVALGAVVYCFVSDNDKSLQRIDFPIILGTAVGNTFGAITCAFLLERFIKFRNSMERVFDTVGFIIFACLIGTTVNAAFYAVGEYYGNLIPFEQLFPETLRWWVPNAVASLVVCPFILAWATWGMKPFGGSRTREMIEAVLSTSCLVGATLLTHSDLVLGGAGSNALAFLPFPFLIWAALRFGLLGATTGTLAVASVAIYSLLNDKGPFYFTNDPTGTKKFESLLLIGTYLCILAVCNLVLASAATELKLAKEAIADNERRLRAVIEDQTEMICRFLPGGIITFVNEAYCRFIKKPSAEIVGTSGIFDLSNSSNLHSQHLEKLTLEAPVVIYDFQIPDPEGVNHWFQCTMRRLFDESGETREYQAVLRNITERKRAEDALRKSEEIFQLISTNVDDLIAVTGADGKRLYNSPSYKRIFGDSSTLLGTHSLAQIHPDDRERVREVFEKTFKTGIGERMEYRFQLPNGEIRHIESVGNFVPGDETEQGKLVTVSRDITARKQIEADLAKARDAAVTAAKQKAEFLANMSHEIRTPMNGVLGMTNLLLKTSLTKAQIDYTDAIRNSADMLLTIINDILDFSKIEAGKMELEKVNYSLFDAVETTLDLLAERAHSKRIELVGFIRPNVPTALRGDVGRLRQIIMNLVGNALKFTHQGEVVVSVSLERDLGETANLRFEVKDTGIGISKEAQQRLFQSFSQADGSTTRKYGGTGLGLAISRQLVIMMGGEIGVESVPDVGSKFFFSIPVEKQVTQPEPQDHKLAGARVMVLDDNVTTRNLLEAWLRHQKMRPEIVQSSKEALQKLREAAKTSQPYRIAMLDMIMPECNGLDFARTIKMTPELENVHLVLMSTPGSMANQDFIDAAGISATINKPLKVSRLVENLTNAVEEKQLQPSSRTTSDFHAPPGVGRAQAPKKNVSILLAEDNQINQLVALGYLKDLGYTCDCVANGVEALEALSRIAYDIVFMDCQMPEMDGYEATKRIRQKEASFTGKKDEHKTIIIAMTANAMIGDREKCLDAGMDDYVSKPIEEEALRSSLDRWVPAILDLRKKSEPESPMPQSPAVVSQAPASSAPSAFQPPANQDKPPVDFKRLSSIAAGDIDRMQQIVDMFVDQANDLMTQLGNAIGQKSIEQVKQIAHKCVGSSANCGMNLLVPPLKQMEFNAREGNLNDAEQLHSTAFKELKRTEKILEEYFASNSQS